MQNEKVDERDGYGNEQQYEHDGARSGFIMARMTAPIDVDAGTCGSGRSAVRDS